MSTAYVTFTATPVLSGKRALAELDELAPEPAQAGILDDEDQDQDTGYHDGEGCCGADMEAGQRGKRSCRRCGGSLMYPGQPCDCLWFSPS